MTTKCRITGTPLFAALLLAGLLVQPAHAQSAAQFEKAVKDAYTKYESLKEGKNADYIPALAKVDPGLFGIAIVTADGKVFTAGDITTEVSIQSISKVFTMAKVIDVLGPKAISDNMGVDATGQVFNSIVAVEQFKGKEMNALVNPGAIATTSMVPGNTSDEVWSNIIET